MQSTVVALATLVRHVGRNRLFAAVLAHGVHEIPLPPERPTPQPQPLIPPSRSKLRGIRPKGNKKCNRLSSIGIFLLARCISLSARRNLLDPRHNGISPRGYGLRLHGECTRLRSSFWGASWMIFTRCGFRPEACPVAFGLVGKPSDLGPQITRLDADASPLRLSCVPRANTPALPTIKLGLTPYPR